MMNRQKIEDFLQFELPRLSRSEKITIAFLIASYNTFVKKPRIRNHEKTELLQYRATTKGHVYNAVYSKRRKGRSEKLEVEYWYYVDGLKYYGSKEIPCIDYKRETAVFKNKEFIVVYSSKNPKNNALLIGYREHLDFGFEFPDSLRPISQQYFNCLESGYW